MSEEVELSVKKLKDASVRLREGIDQAQDELDKDGVIQRFEFTFELLWKALKILLEDRGVICQAPKECLKAAFKIGLIEDEDCFLNMLSDRNKTSHIYSREQSEKIFAKVKDQYASAIEAIVVKMEKWNRE